MIAKALRFGYKIIEVYPLSDLEKHKDHSRLRVFYHKGCTCLNCNHVFTQLALGVDRGGGKHLDVYDDDFYPLTVDHIIPKSLGGSNELENLQPYCYDCNNKKGNGKVQTHVAPSIVSLKDVNKEIGFYLADHKQLLVRTEVSKGDTVYKRVKKTKFKYLGVVDELCINPFTNKKAFKIVGNETSMYSATSFFIERPVLEEIK